MAVDFWSPSYRASASDLTVAISPLGLVELADEEFEVHGPRLNRYSAAWAWYLGHHWAYRREFGESQFYLNYVRTMSDYITNFCFGKGVQFRTPEQNNAIIPHLLNKVWGQHNNKEHVLWEMGQLASVTGDCFVKVAYEEPYMDPIGIPIPGKIRILPLNPAHCFPEYHPHDRTRLLRFKLKYRFWGTASEGTRQVYTFTEIITDDTVEQYINDELVDTYPNAIGHIPIVHIPNTTISSSPWGQSDIWDIIPLNRELNEKMAEVSDIINYHAAPVAIITGNLTIARSVQCSTSNYVWTCDMCGEEEFDLDGSSSYDQNDDELSYYWEEPTGELTWDGIPEAAFISLATGAIQAEYGVTHSQSWNVSLTVADCDLSSTNQVQVTFSCEGTQ